MTSYGQHASGTAPVDASLVEAVASYNCPRCNHPFGSATGHPGPLLTTVPCPHCAAPFLVPGRIGDFVLVDRLASDNMAIVYRATGLTLANDVAIKLIPPYAIATEALRNKFHADVRKATQLTNPHIEKIYALGISHDHAFLVMELLQGETLTHRVATGDRMSECEVLRLALDIADGLQALHDIGLVHGSVKPDNILLCEDGTAKLSCPGLLGSQRRDVAGGLLGTPMYIAPEVITGRPDTPLSDIYTFGITLYYLLTGQQPFAGATPDAIFKGHLFAVVFPVGVHVPTLSAPTRALVERMLKREPYERFVDIHLLTTTIHRVLASLDPTHQAPPVAHRLDTRPDEPPPPLHSPTNQRRLHLLIYALIATVGVVVLAVSLARAPFAKSSAPADRETPPPIIDNPEPPPQPPAPTVLHVFTRESAAAVGTCTQRIKPEWQNITLGETTQHGCTLWSGEKVSISGKGAGIDGVSDSFRFLYASVESPCIFSLRVIQIATTHPHAKTGIMIRGNDSPSAPCVFAGFTGNGDLLLQCRRQPGAETETVRMAPAPREGWRPCYMKLECHNDRFQASVSHDGETWELLGECQSAIPNHSLIGIAIASFVANEMATTECADLRLFTPPAATQPPTIPANNIRAAL